MKLKEQLTSIQFCMAIDLHPNGWTSNLPSVGATVQYKKHLTYDLQSLLQALRRVVFLRNYFALCFNEIAELQQSSQAESKLQRTHRTATPSKVAVATRRHRGAVLIPTPNETEQSRLYRNYRNASARAWCGLWCPSSCSLLPPNKNR